MRECLALKAADFPADAVSKDGRNFPQFAPTKPMSDQNMTGKQIKGIKPKDF